MGNDEVTALQDKRRSGRIATRGPEPVEPADERRRRQHPVDEQGGVGHDLDGALHAGPLQARLGEPVAHGDVAAAGERGPQALRLVAARLRRDNMFLMMLRLFGNRE